MKTEWNFMSGQDSAIKVALDAIEIIIRVSQAMPDLQLGLPASILSNRITKVMEAEGYEV